MIAISAIDQHRRHNAVHRRGEVHAIAFKNSGQDRSVASALEVALFCNAV